MEQSRSWSTCWDRSSSARPSTGTAARTRSRNVKPRGVFHTFWNAGVTPVRFLEVIAPGAFAQYFRELAPLLQGEGPPHLVAVAALAGRFGVWH